VTPAVVGLAVAIALVNALSAVVGYLLGFRSAKRTFDARLRQFDTHLETIIESADRALADQGELVAQLDAAELERQRHDVAAAALRNAPRTTTVN
jgi:hypothetical protein